MPSKIFQPLLYDTFTYKPNNTTYHDTFKWKKLRSFQFKKRVPASEYAQKMRLESNLNENSKKVIDYVSFEEKCLFSVLFVHVPIIRNLNLIFNMICLVTFFFL